MKQRGCSATTARRQSPSRCCRESRRALRRNWRGCPSQNTVGQSGIGIFSASTKMPTLTAISTADKRAQAATAAATFRRRSPSTVVTASVATRPSGLSRKAKASAEAVISSSGRHAQPSGVRPRGPGPGAQRAAKHDQKGRRRRAGNIPAPMSLAVPASRSRASHSPSRPNAMNITPARSSCGEAAALRSRQNRSQAGLVAANLVTAVAPLYFCRALTRPASSRIG